MQDLYEEHIEAINRILKYLKAIPGKGLLLKKTYRRAIKVYTDFDWAELVVDRKSTFI